MNEAISRLLPLIRPYGIEAARFYVREPEPGWLSWRLLSRKPARAFIDCEGVAANE